MYKLKRDAVEELKHKYNLSGVAISLMVTAGESSYWYHNRVSETRNTLATEQEVERLANILMCDVSDIAVLVEAGQQNEPEPKQDRTVTELLEAILEKLMQIAEPWNTK